jgi:hypothetical protein
MRGYGKYYGQSDGCGQSFSGKKALFKKNKTHNHRKNKFRGVTAGRNVKAQTENYSVKENQTA